MRSALLSLFALFCFTFTAFAADVTGKWTAQLPGREGTRTTTFLFTVSGDSLTGSVQTPQGESPISEGKVDGDTISFVETRSVNGNEIKVTYTGKVKGDTIEFTREGGRGRGGRGRPATFTATKAN